MTWMEFLCPNCSWVLPRRGRSICVGLWLLCCVGFAAEAPEPSGEPPSPPARATNQLASFHVQPGFRIELVASEPSVNAPFAIAFDENGRLFVAEMRDYPNKRDASPHLGRIRVLSGMDTNGVFQSSSVYADDLAWPSAVSCYAGGVFVATTPDIIYLKDSKGDGVADVRRVVFSGFGGTNAPNPRALLNSFSWGLDNRIHAATAGLGGIIVASNWPTPPVSVSGSDFSFDPRSLAVFTEAGPSQSGISFDQNGRRYTCDFNRPLRLAMYEQRYGLRNPFYLQPPEFVDLASLATPIFHSPTPVKAKAGSPGNGGSSNLAARVETTALASTWLTNAHGCLIYRGNAYATNYLGNAFIADPSAHAVHRLILRENGIEPVAERPAEERQSEFLSSNDPSFRPVQLVGGPDGVIYVVDSQDDGERGRIYRVVPVNFKRPKPPQAGKGRTYDLVAALAGNDGWHLDTASRLLFERRDPNAVGLLTNMLNNSRVGSARLRAMHALDGLEALREPQLLRALQDPDARVREHGVLLVERLATNGIVSDAVWSTLKGLAGDPAVLVRYQLAFTVGEFARQDRALILAEVIRRDPLNRYIQSAVLSSLAEGAGNLFVILAGDPSFLNDPGGNAFLRELALLIGSKGRADEVRQVTAFLTQNPLDRLQLFGMLAALGEGLRNTRSSLAMASPQSGLERYFSTAMEAAIDSFSPPAVRIQAVRLTGVSSLTFTDTSDWLLMLCNPQPWPELRATAVSTVAHYDDLGAVTGLLDRWSTFPPFLRHQGVAALLSRRRHVLAVIETLERGRLPVGDVSSAQRDFLRTYPDPVISQRAQRLFGPAAVHRPQTLDLFRPALRLTGIRERGQNTFAARCAGCHRLGGIGQAFGPSLVGARTAGKESILNSIIEPNAVVPSEYTTCLVQTLDGDNLIGIEANENLASVSLRQPGGTGVVCPRVNVGAIYLQSWSLMPEGLEEGLSPQDMADLLEYIVTAAR